MNSQPISPLETPSTGRLLPSGRSVIVRLSRGCEELEVRSPDGMVEVQILLTEQGPVVRLAGARLELESPDSIAVRCRHFEVHSREETTLHSDGAVRLTGQELRARTQGDIHLDGEYILLNCEEVAPGVIQS